MGRWPILASVVAAALAGAARAAEPGWTACRIAQGVLVVPAQAAGLTGAFVLDTAAARSTLDATQASLAGLDSQGAVVPVRLGGRRLARVDMAIAALDARTQDQPTPITGVLGVDVLKGRVLEVEPDPCRFRLTAHAAPQRDLASLPLDLIGGVPYVRAGVSDGASARRGVFRMATGGAPAVRLSPAVARLEGAPAGSAGLTAPLRALSLGGLLIEQPLAAIAAQAEPGVSGDIGEPVWAAYGLSLDLRRRRLTLYAPPPQLAFSPCGGRRGPWRSHGRMRGCAPLTILSSR